MFTKLATKCISHISVHLQFQNKWIQKSWTHPEHTTQQLKHYVMALHGLIWDTNNCYSESSYIHCGESMIQM